MKTIFPTPLFCLTALASVSASSVLADSTDAEYGMTLIWDSKYITEGRNNLDEGGLLSLELVASWDSISTGIWLADGTDSSYNELNFFLEYDFDIGNASAYLGYTRLEFPDDNASDNEISAGIVWPILNAYEFGIHYVHATETDGGFLDLVFAWKMPQTNPNVSITPYVSQSIDFGYASDTHDGENNFQLGIESSWNINESWSFVGMLAHSWAQKDIDRDSLGDETWVSLGLATNF